MSKNIEVSKIDWLIDQSIENWFIGPIILVEKLIDLTIEKLVDWKIISKFVRVNWSFAFGKEHYTPLGMLDPLLLVIFSYFAVKKKKNYFLWQI